MRRNSENTASLLFVAVAFALILSVALPLIGLGRSLIMRVDFMVNTPKVFRWVGEVSIRSRSHHITHRVCQVRGWCVRGASGALLDKGKAGLRWPPCALGR